MKSIRWGIIDCGVVTEIKSGPAYYKVPGVAVMRRNKQRALDYARRHNVAKVYDSADQLISDKDIDAIKDAVNTSM